MPLYKVADAHVKKEIPDGAYGPMKVIGLTLTDSADALIAAEWFTKAQTPLPADGTTLEGDVTEGQYGLKFKPTQSRGFGGGAARSPEDRKSIIRQHSQEMAMRALELGATWGVVKAPEDSKKFLALIEWMTDHFVRDAGK